MNHSISIMMISILLGVAKLGAVTYRTEGEIEFRLPMSENLVRCGFRAECDGALGTSKLIIWKLASPAVMEYEHSSQPGEEFLESISFCELGRSSGNLMVVRWGRGASLAALSIIGVKADGHIGILFDDACEQGYQIVDVTGDEWPEIVAVDGRYGAKRYTARIYGYDSSGKIDLIAKDETTLPHRYALLRDKNTPILDKALKP